MTTSMNFVKANNRADQKRFLDFRKTIYKERGLYVDNGYFMVCEIFSDKLNFTHDRFVCPVYITEGEKILCECIFFWAKEMPEYLQLCFFEALPDCEKAVSFLLKKAEKQIEKWADKGCKKLVIGLHGHLNYGLGLLASHYDQCNSFSSPGNPEFYIDYFRNAGCKEVLLNSYRCGLPDTRISRYDALLRKLYKNYSFRYFDKKHFKEDAKLFCDLNNECFYDHRYYYNREYIDDYEMLKELFLFMKEDSIIYAFNKGKPAGFILWYPDFNELAKCGEAFGTKHFFTNKICGSRIKTAKVMEYGVLEEYRGSGLALALIQKAYEAIQRYGITEVETSWVMADNADSNSFCKELCDGLYKKYIVFEK